MSIKQFKLRSVHVDFQKDGSARVIVNGKEVKGIVEFYLSYDRGTWDLNGLKDIIFDLAEEIFG